MPFESVNVGCGALPLPCPPLLRVWRSEADARAFVLGGIYELEACRFKGPPPLIHGGNFGICSSVLEADQSDRGKALDDCWSSNAETANLVGLVRNARKLRAIREALRKEGS